MDIYILTIIFLIFTYLIFQINNIKKNKEEFGNSSASDLSTLVAAQVNSVYKSDIDAIKNLSIIAKGLTQPGGYTVNGGLTISGLLNVANTQINSDLTVSGKINGININDMNATINNLTAAATKILNDLNTQASQNVQNIVNSQASQVAASQAIVNSQASQVAASQNLLNSQITYNKINVFKLIPNSAIDATTLILNVPAYYILGNGSFVPPQLGFTGDQVNSISLKAENAVAPTVTVDANTTVITNTNADKHHRRLWNHNKGYRIDTTNLGLPFSTAYYNSNNTNSTIDLLINNAHYYFTVVSCLNTNNCIRIIIDTNGNVCLTLMKIADLVKNTI